MAMGGVDVGDANAASAMAMLRALFIEHNHGLVQLAGLLTRDQGAAEEIAQEAFVRLHGALPRLRDPDAALPYLRKTVINLSRSRGRRLTVVARYRPAPSPDADAADLGALRSLDRCVVLDAIAKLSARQRECVVLRFYQDLSESETAAVLGVSPNSVKKHMQRATASLAARLEDRR